MPGADYSCHRSLHMLCTPLHFLYLSLAIVWQVVKAHVVIRDVAGRPRPSKMAASHSCRDFSSMQCVLCAHTPALPSALYRLLSSAAIHLRG